MKTTRVDFSILILIALFVLLVHMATNHRYGFHRDELALLDAAQDAAWGYVAYPPVTPAIARVALALFGPSMVGVRFFSALAQSVAIVLTGLMARELGGSRRAQVIAAVAMAIAPLSLIQGALFQYVSFDYLWWVAIAYAMVRLLKTEDARWWLAIGAGIGLGMMTKYTMVFCVAGIVGGVLLTPARRYLRSRPLWLGVGLSLLIFLPNLLWQIRHDFISLEFLRTINARDVAIGRTSGFLIEQLFVPASPFTVPLWLAGLVYYFHPAGARFRPLGWMYVIPLLLFLVANGRSYYLAPAYPMLLAAGSVVWVGWLERRSSSVRHAWMAVTMAGLVLGALVGGLLMLPIAPVNSLAWEITREVHDNFVEEIGWPELTETVAQIYHALPADEQARTGILAGNYGEAGAINLYGPALDLPTAISGVNSYWQRGYGDPPPSTLIVVGFTLADAEQYFADCELAGQITNRYGVENEETRNHPHLFLCREPRQPWPDLWQELRRFG